MHYIHNITVHLLSNTFHTLAVSMVIIIVLFVSGHNVFSRRCVQYVVREQIVMFVF